MVVVGQKLGRKGEEEEEKVRRMREKKWGVVFI